LWEALIYIVAALIADPPGKRFGFGSVPGVPGCWNSNQPARLRVLRKLVFGRGHGHAESQEIAAVFREKDEQLMKEQHAMHAR
jgi:hypothetical protein